MRMFERWMETDLNQLPKVEDSGLTFSQDSGANKLGVKVFDNGDPVTLSGTVKAWVVRANGTTIQINGSKSGNTAWVVLTSDAYAVVGRIGVFIKLLSGNDVTTLGGFDGYVYRTM